VRVRHFGPKPLPGPGLLDRLSNVDEELVKQLREAGVPQHLVPELARLASEIEALPEVDPRRAWLRESKRRLLECYEAQQTGRSAHPPGTPHPSEPPP
jgi:hypothetical protein